MKSEYQQNAENMTSYQKWEERRQYKRFPTDLSVRFRELDKDDKQFSKGAILNVSLGGMFIRTDTLRRTGTSLEIYINILTPFGEIREVNVHALVAWLSHNPEEMGIGLQFTKIDRHTQYALLACAHRQHT